MMTAPHVLLTMLNNMAGGEVDQAFDRHVELGLQVLDLKDSLFGKGIEDLTHDEAGRVKVVADARGLSVHTLSTRLFGGDIESGRQAFQDANVASLEHVISLAQILQPHQVRLLMASSSRRSEILHSGIYLSECHPWVVEVYQDAVDRLTAAGQRTVIENEVGGCLFSTPDEITSFFSALDREGNVRLTWDIQNLWQMGTFPSLGVYYALKPYIGMIHLKGGRAELPGGKLRWRAYLEDASWPVVEIVGQVIADGVSRVICLNPSHGENSPDYSFDVAREIEFLRRTFKEVA